MKSNPIKTNTLLDYTLLILRGLKLIGNKVIIIYKVII